VALRLTLIILIGGAAVALTAALAAPAATTGPLLIGTTGPDPVITLKWRGKRVTRLKPGKYRIRVYDREYVHDFRLRGPRLNKTITTTLFVGAKLVTVTLRKGRYEYYCAPHYYGGMNGKFLVG
jgi:Copper binding proteins, plastocyanin/azurin family